MEKLDIPTSNHHVGSTERVFVAHVNDLNDFYLHPELVREPLVKLGQDLYNEYSGSLTKPPSVGERLVVGSYCACPSESEDWYRGLIRQLDSTGLATVFKIDYGDVQFVPVQFLRPLLSRFFDIDCLAFHCSLVNLIKPISGWSFEVVEEFRRRLTTTFLYAKFINYNEIRDISEVEITEKSSKVALNKDFEENQTKRSGVQISDKFIYKQIPIEPLDPTQPNTIRILYYTSPSRFYVYLPEKRDSHTNFQIDLQDAMQDCSPISSPKKYQLVAAQDNHAIWHRAAILDCTSDPSKVSVYFLDIGQREYISIHNVRQLPEDFQRKPAFAIPCRLYDVCPINGSAQSTWACDDPVHNEFHRLMVNNVSCTVCAKQDHMCYDVEIEIPKVGDLGAFLFENNLLSRSTMHYPQRPSLGTGQVSQNSFVRAQLTAGGLPPSRLQQRSAQQQDYLNNSNTTIQQTPNRTLNAGLQNVPVQQSYSTSANTSSASSIPTGSPQSGYYTITQVHSATEFYGVAQTRERELNSFSKTLDDYYNNATNDQSLNVAFLEEGLPCIIQHGVKYQRVIVKSREGGSRVSVKLVDHGEEILVDTSELLQIQNQALKTPAFAQPFRLHGFHESQNSAAITRALKKLIFNQYVRVTVTGSMVNGFCPVEVTLSDNQSVNQLVLSADKNPSVTSPTSNVRPPFNPPSAHHVHVESLVFNNSNKQASRFANQDFGGRLDMTQQTNSDLPAPQKILTGSTRTPSGRFGITNQLSSAPPSSNEPISSFSNMMNRNQQGPSQSNNPTISNPAWNRDQNNQSSFSNRSSANQPPSGRQPSNSAQFSNNRRSDEQPNRFPSTTYDNQQSMSEPKRSFGGGYSQDDRSEKQMSGNTFQQKNDFGHESGTRRGGFSNRGASSGFESRGGFSSRSASRYNDENNGESTSHFSGGFNKRGGGFSDRGDHNRNFQDRNGANRHRTDDYSESNTQRSQNFSSDRGSFRGGRGGGVNGPSNRRDQDDRGGYRREGGFNGAQRGGGFRGGRGEQSGFRDRGTADLQLSSDTNNFSKPTNSWPSTRVGASNFEAGDRFVENDFPKSAFEFAVSHIESVNDFFVQLSSKLDAISDLSETLQTEYKQSPEVGLSSFKINQPCLAKSSDGCWYRAIVLSTGLSQLKVRFIDFGDTAEVQSKTIRQLAKKHCATPAYAYRCSFPNVKVVENIQQEKVVAECAEPRFHGKILSKTSDGKFTLQSDDFLQLLLGLNAITLSKSDAQVDRIKCLIVHISPEEQRFYIQDNEEIIEQISELIAKEDENSPTLSLDEVKQLKPNTVVIAKFDDEPYRAIIQSDEMDEHVNVRYIDFGNTSLRPKSSLKLCSEQLSQYPSQSKQCQLFGIPSEKIESAFEYLQEHSDSENIQVVIVKKEDQLHKVLVFDNDQCMNEKFGYTSDMLEDKNAADSADHQSDATKEEEILLETEKPSKDDTPTVVESETDAPEIEETSSKYHQALLTHVEQDKPYVYLQIIPESTSNLERIEDLIDEIIQKKEQNSSYEVGNHVIAQFSEDDGHYRARIESYSSSSQLYKVYFLDYGNLDDNVPIDHLYPYSDELEQIEPQAHGYLLDGINANAWNEKVRSLFEDQKNETIEFYFPHDDTSTIRVRSDDENQIYDAEQNSSPVPEQPTTKTANISATNTNSFYIHILPAGNLNVGELEDILSSCEKEHQSSWTVNDLCIVSNEQNRYFRGQILAMTDGKYDVKCIDYGNELHDLSDNHLYALPNEERLKQPPIARQCRLYGIDDDKQAQAIEEVIKNIEPTERVTIDIKNNLDDQCLIVVLTREDHQIVNDQYGSDDHQVTTEQEKSDNNEMIAPKSVDVNTTSSNEQDDVPQVESSVLTVDPKNVTEVDPMVSMIDDRTMDFGEKDIPTILEDEVNRSTSSN